MKHTHRILLFPAVLACLWPVNLVAEDGQTNQLNRISLSARLGFNISARFSGMGGGSGAAPAPGRTTPDGTPYNYDNGYVLTDISTNAGGLTWNWGYDDTASQVVGNTVVLSRTQSSTGVPSSADMDASDPFVGAELVYSRQLGRNDKGWKWGVDLAANFLPLDFSQSAVYAASANVTRDAYPFFPGTTPPTATPGNPYQGTFAGPGFVIGATPVSSTTSVVPGAVVASDSSLDAILWGLRLGPYVEVPLGERFRVSLNGGLALGFLDADVSWNEVTTAPGGTPVTASGGGSDTAVLVGAYAGASVAWDFTDHWSVIGGAQFQYLGSYEQSFDGRSVELDFGQAIFATLGLLYSF